MDNIDSPSTERLDARPASAAPLMLRVLGAFILCAGLFSAYQIGQKLWSLLESQESIVRFADEIDAHSHINAFVNQMNIIVDFVNKAKSAIPAAPGQPASAAPAPAPSPVPEPPLNAAYFIAWTLTLIVLGLTAKISFWAIAAGGKLALFSIDHEQQLKRILRELVLELRRTGSRA